MKGAEATTPPALPVLDAQALAGLRALDPTGKSQLMERVFTAFRTSTERLLPQLLESHGRADLAGMRYVAHTLKSSAASVGGMKLSGICAALEARIRLNETDDLKPQVQALQEEAERLLMAIQQYSTGAGQ